MFFVIANCKNLFKIVFLSLLFFSFFKSSYSQIIDHRIEFDINYNTWNFYGDKSYIKSDGNIWPTFYPNFETVRGKGAGVSVRINKYMRFGAKLHYIEISDHQFECDTFLFRQLYNEDKINQLYFIPTLRFNTPLKDHGLFNRIVLYLDINALLGYTSVLVNEPIHISRYVDKTKFKGYGGAVGIKYSRNQYYGFYFENQFNIGFLQSDFHYDEQFIVNGFKFGVFFKFLKYKRYYY